MPMSRNAGTLKITISGSRAVTEALNAAIDNSRLENGEFTVKSEAQDIGDLRAQLNLTLRVINAALESIGKAK